LAMRRNQSPPLEREMLHTTIQTAGDRKAALVFRGSLATALGTLCWDWSYVLWSGIFENSSRTGALYIVRTKNVVAMLFDESVERLFRKVLL